MPESASGTQRHTPQHGRVVVTGAAGQVGRFLAGEAGRRGRAVVALGSADCDITDPRAPERFLRAGDLVVNCAAYTDVDGAEAHQAAAYAVNATGAGNVAHACARVGARLLHLSTDYVFGGGPVPPRPYEPGDDTAPVNVYGKTKLAGELAVLAAMPDAVVVRTSWVYTGADGTDFAAVMRRRAERSEPTEVVADQVGSPTYVADLVSALFEIADGPVREPVLHAANAGAASRYEQARAVFTEVGADPGLVRPIDSTRHPRPARRPPYSALGSEVSAAAGLTPLRPWRDALREALHRGQLPSTP